MPREEYGCSISLGGLLLVRQRQLWEGERRRKEYWQIGFKDRLSFESSRGSLSLDSPGELESLGALKESEKSWRFDPVRPAYWPR